MPQTRRAALHQSRTLYVGVDVPKESIAVAYVAQAHGADVVSLGTVGTRQCAIDTRSRPLQSKSQPRVCVYAAGPGGSWLYRSLTKTGDVGGVVAPAWMPKKAADRGKPDRRDARQLARLMRSGDLTPVSGPAGHDAALRDLRRARAETRHALQPAKFRRKAWLRRHDIRYPGRATWGPAPLRWLSEVVWATPAQQIVFQADVRAVTDHTARRQRLEPALQEQGTAWRLCPVVAAVQALRGGPFTGAVTPVAELGDLPRVENPRHLLTDLDLTPAEYSRGERRRQGGSTQTGKTQARRAVVAGAWASRDPAQGSRHLPPRLAKLPKPIQDVSWKAQVRLCKRYRQLNARGKNPNQVVVAIARELSACMWAIAKQVPVTA